MVPNSQRSVVYKLDLQFMGSGHRLGGSLFIFIFFRCSAPPEVGKEKPAGIKDS